MNAHSQTPAVGLDLRERRRRDMVRAIAAAALDLFERNGFAATTIDDIAAAAGISRTTFFRHCATKEAAVLVDDAGLEAELIAIAKAAAGTNALAKLEAAWEDMTTVFDSDPEGRNRFLRVRRLMRDNQALLAAGLERDARLTEHIAEALTHRKMLTVIDAQAVAHSFALGMRLTFDEWVRTADHDSPDASLTLSEAYVKVRAALARAHGAVTP